MARTDGFAECAIFVIAYQLYLFMTMRRFDGEELAADTLRHYRPSHDIAG